MALPVAVSNLRDWVAAYAEGSGTACFVWFVPPYVTADMIQIEDAFEDSYGAVPRRAGIYVTRNGQRVGLTEEAFPVGIWGQVYEAASRSESYRAQVRGELPLLTRTERIGGHIFWGMRLDTFIGHMQNNQTQVLMTLPVLEDI